MKTDPFELPPLFVVVEFTLKGNGARLQKSAEYMHLVSLKQSRIFI